MSPVALQPSQVPLPASFKLLVVGCGHMGAALLNGCIAQGLGADQLFAIDPELTAARERLTRLSGATLVTSLGELEKDFTPSLVLFAVKPPVVSALIPQYRLLAERGAIFVSIAAGITVGFLEKLAPRGTPIIRAMPNLPAAIGHGVTVLCANVSATDEYRALCAQIFALVGKVIWLEHEDLFDAVTGVSGSGPAYLFALAEALADAGVAAGLSQALAEELANRTICGAARLLEVAKRPPRQLRAEVTSPKGTTEAALDVLLRRHGMPDLIKEAVRAAAIRSRSLAI